MNCFAPLIQRRTREGWLFHYACTIFASNYSLVIVRYLLVLRSREVRITPHLLLFRNTRFGEIQLTHHPIEENSLSNRFLSIKKPAELATLLGTSHKDLSRILFHKKTNNYRTFHVQKRKGGTRTLQSPTIELKRLQRKLHELLITTLTFPASAYGYLPHKGIVRNASMHSSKKHVLNIDIKDFFPTINFGRVRGLFMAHPFYLPAPVATCIARICCFNNELPQGAPTSPVISNIICRKMDRQLQDLARKYKCTYTRYADDISLSSTLRTFPKAIAIIHPDGIITIGAELFWHSD